MVKINSNHKFDKNELYEQTQKKLNIVYLRQARRFYRFIFINAHAGQPLTKGKAKECR